MGTRRQSRELALQILFQSEFEKELNCEQALALYRGSFDSEPEVWDYAKLLVKGIFDFRAKVDQTIQKYARHWKIDRMGIVDRNILRIAVFELKFMDRDVPVNVVLNEAIEVAKKFGTADSGPFVNGILDQISRDQDTDQDDQNG